MQNLLNLFDPTYLISWFQSLPLMKLFVAVLLFGFFLLLRRIFALIVLKVLKGLFAKTKTELDDKSIHILLGPVSFIFIIIGFNAFLTMLDIKTPFLSRVSKSLIVFDLFWFLYYLVSLGRLFFENLTQKYAKNLSKELMQLIERLFKFTVIFLGIMTLLQVWGINITAFVASLGLGGLAFALAAKDSAANIFGSFAILADKAIRIGEWIEVDGVEGIVQDIGMRTTKIQTFENSTITIPNQIIANTKIINHSRRHERRIKFHIGLTYDTTPKQIQEILSQLKEMLRNHPHISQRSTQIVRFDHFSESSLNLLIYCFTDTADWQEYLKIKEDINLKVITIIHNNGSDFAFPSRSLYIEKGSIT